MKRRRRKTRLVNIKIPQKFLMPIAFVIGVSTGYFIIGEAITPNIQLNTQEARVCFTPGGNCASQVISAIDKAREEILVQAYAFTSSPIAEALIKAKNRGVRVEVLFDKKASQDSHSQISTLGNEGIKVYPEKTNGIAHNKVIIIDRNLLITGTYNWPNSAEHRNSENLLIISNPELAQQYAENWKRLTRLEQ